MSGLKKLAIVGISGRMGAELVALAPAMGFDVTMGVSRSAATHADSDSDSNPKVNWVSSVDGLNLSLVDVVIDFSLPENTNSVVAWCVKNNRPLVSGVTGVSKTQKEAFLQAGRTIAVLWAPNMSLGVAVVSKMLAQLAALEDFDFQIEEIHHKGKKDAPSGTALFLQEQLEYAVGKVPAPVAIRGGGVFGIHRIWAMGEEETVTIEHNAMNRRVFARGGLRASQWILGQPPGYYSMNDVLSGSASSLQV